MQVVLNEDQFGPLDNDSVILVIQVSAFIVVVYRIDIKLGQLISTGAHPNHVPSSLNYKPSPGQVYRTQSADLLARFLR